ncbi:hypothetical protein N7492_009676 [Penicillium capsulatum]|uniref:Phosphoglycerate mutase family protein n=1 Tax=Penicillium capsulatum TaxID=69766 RepID=A0A9W9HUE3_9EURO|nr:hypothetical protein N7492_009676 [Penicillium capsulatum]KAJ6107061.1 hypothetical protein N7512_010578 [Penicillium capsulatum]
MAEYPSIVFIARHGARLDAADKDWHLTSPTPYDPPLAYGGWVQSRALGARIASLLQAPQFTGQGAENERSQSPASDDLATLQSTATSDHLYRQYNVIIHTSPYLRCLQTAIAVSAGLNQNRSGVDTPDSAGSESKPHPTPHALDFDPRPRLRVDAFLGEWLSPDYFDQIIPPPSSDRMVASAKAELLRREAILAPREGPRAPSGHFPGGWGSLSHPASPSEEEDRHLGSSRTPATSAQHVQRQRANTYDTQQNPTPANRAPKTLGRLNTNLPPIADSAYVPPTPAYAISASDPIPTGYVAHARDACTKIDYQWDSLRTPFWGNGGEYGEEWSSMHERVDDGFRRMVDWYRRQDGPCPTNLDTTPEDAVRQDRAPQTVLVIITHGADCNALISSLTGHSVLLDIGTASLTMAVRQDRVKSMTPDSDHARDSPSPPVERSISQEYALQLVASTDHLRAGANPSQLASLSSPSAAQPLPAPPAPSYRNRLNFRPSGTPGSFTIGAYSEPKAGSRVWSLATRPAAVPRGASGLWKSIASPHEKDEDTDESFVPDFGEPRPLSRASSHSSDATSHLPQRTLSQRGLWGSAPSLEEREAESRRRWPVTEQQM